MHTRNFAAVALAMALALGCSQATSTGGKDGQTAQSSNGEAKGLPVPDTKPEFVVKAFLDALSRGDKDHTAQLLTDKARAETKSKGLVVSPESVPHASYKVADAEILADNPNGAHVCSVWTEKFEDGSQEEYEIVWVLRKQKDGWRIAGMATELAPGQKPLYLNFEDPEDMLRKKDEAMKEAQATAAAVTASAPPAANSGNQAGPPRSGQIPEAVPANKLRR